jgi:hypothetical protein
MHYSLDDSLIPEGYIKIKCRVCQNIFTLNKVEGVFKKEPAAKIKSVEHDSAAALNKEPDYNNSMHSSSVPDDFMQSIMAEINNKQVQSERSGEAIVSNRIKTSEPDLPMSRKGKTTPFQIAMLIVLIILFLIAGVSALIHYGIIDIPFLPSDIMSIMASI